MNTFRVALKRISIFAAVACLFIFCSQAVTAYSIVQELSAETVSQLGKDNCYWIISGEVDLTGRTISVGNSVLDFQGGSIKGGRLNLSKAEIKAGAYCIFDGCTITAAPANARVYADWFGTPGDDASTMIQDALDACPVRTVVLGRSSYTVKHPIHFNQQWQSLKGEGTLHVHKDFPADSAILDLRASFLDIKLRSITADGVSSNVNSYRGTAVAFTGNVYYSSVCVEIISGLKNGFLIEPRYFSTTGKTRYSQVLYNNLDFTRMTVHTGIKINLGNYQLTSGVASGGTEYYTGFNECIVNGGVINGQCGVYIEDSQYLRNKKNSGYLVNYDCQSVIFNNLNIDNCTGTALRLRYCDFCFFPYLYISGSPSNKGALIDLSGCRFTELGLKNPLTDDRIKIGRDVRGVYIDGMGDTDAGNLFAGTERLAIFTDSLYGGESRKYMTSRIAPANMVKTMEFKSGDGSSSLTMGLDSLLVHYDSPTGAVASSGPTRMLNNLCVINVEAGRKISLDLSRNSFLAFNPMTVVLHVNSGGSFRVLSDKGKSRDLSTGTYLLTRTAKGETTLEKLS